MKKIINLTVISLAFSALTACAQTAPIAQAQADATSSKPQAKAPLTQGANHIGFTVSDLSASTGFFTGVLGWSEVGGDPSYPSRFVSDGEIFVTLWQASSDQEVIAFNRKANVGLHHFAMTVPDLETLDELHETLKGESNVTIEFAPEFLGNGPTTHMMIREPSGLRIEFIVPGGKRRAAN